jgi:SPP1 family predicted phage head-tail adaptor
MKAGELKTQITIKQNQPVAKNELGDDIPNWVTFKTVRAKAMIGNGREFYAVQKINSEVSGLLQGRYRECSDITEKMRAVCEYGTFEIISSLPMDQNHKDWELKIKKVV